MDTFPGFPADAASQQAYRARFWSFAWPTPLLVSAIGAVLWWAGEGDMALAMWVYSLLQALFLAGFLLKVGPARLFAGLSLYSYVLFSFVVVLLFGGILRSGGVVFVGLAGALFSLAFLGPRHFRILSALFFVSVVLEVGLQPFVPAPAALGEQANRLLFVAHLLVVAQVVFQTISEYVRQNLAARQRETERLKHLDSLKSDFYTGITHAFRTPLTVILGMAEQIRRAPEDYGRAGADMIRESGTRLLHLVNQMLDLGKLESGHMELHLVQGDIRPYLEYLVEPFRRLAGTRDVQVHFSMVPEALVMDHDPEKTASLVDNLLSNALKHAPEGTDIQVVVEVVEGLPEPGPSTYCLFARGEVADAARFLKVGIRDEGVGIPLEEMPRIFERYRQVEQPLDQGAGGTGIGLAIVRALLDLLGGQLYLDSQVGRGSLFTLFLPITTDAPRKESLPRDASPGALAGEGETDLPAPAPPGQEGARLLLIEDHPGVVAYLRTVLGETYRLEVAADGEEGIARALEEIPDLIITDLMMPGKDGFAVCETLKGDIRSSHIPIIMLTARAEAESKLEGLALGADDYLVKPFDPRELTARVRNLLRTRERLRHRYQLGPARPGSKAPSQDLDDQFIDRVSTVLQRHVDDEQFDTEKLARALHMSRTQLFRKLKALTGHSASQVIRQFRMDKAKALILGTDRNISEIAYAVGFKDPAYFSKVFARTFGMAPTECRQGRDVPS